MWLATHSFVFPRVSLSSVGIKFHVTSSSSIKVHGNTIWDNEIRSLIQDNNSYLSKCLLVLIGNNARKSICIKTSKTHYTYRIKDNMMLASH